MTCDDGTSYKTGVEKSYKHPRFQEQSSTFTLSVMSLNSTSLIIIMLSLLSFSVLTTRSIEMAELVAEMSGAEMS